MNPQTCHQQTEQPHDFPDLWRECVAADADWASLVRRVDPLLRSTLTALARSYGTYLTSDLLDELIQETYLRLLQKDRRGLRGCRAKSETTIRSYLRRVARSTLVDWLRARSALKRGAVVELHVGVEAGLAEDTELVELPSRAYSPIDAIYARELRSRFRSECRGVARPGGTALRDTWMTERMVVDGWNSREAANAVQLAPATVATVVGRMRRALRRRGLMMPARLNSRV